MAGRAGIFGAHGAATPARCSMDMTMTLRRYFIASSLLGLNIAAGTAQGADTVASHPCAGIGEDSARLACYDRAFGRGPAPAPMSAPASAKPVAAAPVAAAASTAAVVPAVDRSRKGTARVRPERGGQTGPGQQQERPAGTGKPHGHREERVSTANRGAGLRARERPGLGGERPSPPARVQPGDEVTVRKGALGSYLLVTPKRSRRTSAGVK